MISDRAMTTLRVAATIGHVLPGVGVRVHHAEQLLLEVVPHRSGACSPAAPGAGVVRTTPAAFRGAVARAHARRQAGEALRFLSLGPGCEPAVEMGVPADGTVRPGDIYRVPIGGRWLWATATTLGADTAYRLGLDLVDAALPVAGVPAMGIRPDPLTGVSVAYVETTAGPGSPEEAVVVDLLEALLARWTAHALVATLQGDDLGVAPRRP